MIAWPGNLYGAFIAWWRLQTGDGTNTSVGPSYVICPLTILNNPDVSTSFRRCPATGATVRGVADVRCTFSTLIVVSWDRGTAMQLYGSHIPSATVIEPGSDDR
jgi:hypothetical protein